MKMGNDYLGKTNKELIIEVIGKVNNIEKALKVCRPVCFDSKEKIAVMEQKQKDLKWVVMLTAALATAAFNVIFWIVKKIKGGG